MATDAKSPWGKKPSSDRRRRGGMGLHWLGAVLAPEHYYRRYREAIIRRLNTLWLLSKTQPIQKRLDEGYIPVYLVDLAPKKIQRQDASKPIDVWDALFRSPRLIFTGKAGSGKTTLLRYLAVSLALGKMPTGFIRRLTLAHQGTAVDELVPIYVRMSDFAKDRPNLFEHLLTTFAEFDFPHAKDFLTTKLEAGECLLLLDGVDEVSSAEHTKQIAEFAHLYPRNQLILTSRNVCVTDELADFTTLEIVGFGEKECQNFISTMLGARSSTFWALLQAIERSPGLQRLATTPLFLSAMISEATESRPPFRLASLHAASLDILLHTWAQTRRPAGMTRPDPQAKRNLLQELALHYHRQRLTHMPREEFEPLLREAMSHAGLGSENAEEILRQLVYESGVLRYRADVGYAFADLALQEYLSARHLLAQNALSEALGQVNDPWWQEVIVLAAGMQPDATDIIRGIQAQSTDHVEGLLLAGRCLAEAQKSDIALREEITERLFALFEQDLPQVWPRAGETIAALFGKRTRDYFSGLLQDSDPAVRLRAVTALGQIGQEWALGPLGAMLDDEEWQIRKKAAWALGRIGDGRERRVVSQLINALRDTNEEVAEEATIALGRLGKISLRPLLSCLEDDRERVYRSAVRALSLIGEPIVERLIEVLDNEQQNPRIRRGVAEALGEIGDVRAIPHLIDIFHTRDADLKQAAEIALGKMGKPAVEPLIAALPTQDVETALGAVEALRRIGEAAIPYLIDALDGEGPEVRGAAMKALTRIGEPAIPALTKALFDSRWQVRRRAARILHSSSSDLVIEPAIRALSDEDEGVRAIAARILAEMGDERAVEPLAQVARTDPSESVRREAIRALGMSGNELAVAPLLEALNDPRLRRNSAGALIELGEVAVEPLIAYLHQSDSGEVRDAVIGILGAIGERGRVEDQSMCGLAKVYHALLTEPLDIDSILKLTSQLDWWDVGGEELYLTFKTAATFLAVGNLEDMAAAGSALDWLQEREAVVSPVARRILWALKDIIENTRAYLSMTQREGQRNALLSAIDKIDDIEQLVEQRLLGAEKRVFGQVIARWRELITEAVKRMRGRAEIEFELLTDRLALRDARSSAILVFRLINVGDSVARNMKVTLKPMNSSEFEVLGGQTRALDPLGSGMQREVEFPVQPHGAREVNLIFEVQYDDDERVGYICPFSGRVSFYEVETTYIPIRTSPYIAGKPVKTEEMFFGRSETFNWLRENVSGRYQENVLVLYGERRIGKTSVLYQLMTNPPTPHHICVFFDMETSAMARREGEFLYSMAKEVYRTISPKGYQLDRPQWSDYDERPEEAFRDFVDDLERALGEYRLIVMLDEFGVLMRKVSQEVFSPGIFDFIRAIIQHTNKLAFLFTGAYELRRMQKDYHSILFNLAKVHKLSYLHPQEAEDLIITPMKGLLDYHPLAVDKILKVTACHPYFIQYICDSLVRLVQRERRNYVDLMDVNNVLQDTIQDATGNIENALYGILSDAEKMALAGLANVTDDVRLFVPSDAIYDILQRKSLKMSRQELLQALEQLRERDLIQERRLGQQLQYSFKMGLVRMWLKQNEVLLRLQEEFAP